MCIRDRCFDVRDAVSDVTLPLLELTCDKLLWLSLPSPEEDARGLSDDFEPGILVLSVFLSDRVLSFVSDLLKDGYDPRSGPCCPARGVCDPLVSVSFDCWLPILTSSSLSQYLLKLLFLFSSLGRYGLRCLVVI